MIIGSTDELISLGRSLIAAGESSTTAPVSADIWPPVVAEFTPASNDGCFKVSFHIDTAADGKPKTNFPRKFLWSRWHKSSFFEQQH